MTKGSLRLALALTLTLAPFLNAAPLGHGVAFLNAAHPPTAYAADGLTMQAAVGQAAVSDWEATRYEPAALAELTVTKVADTNDGTCDADCSLREAVAAATIAAANGGDTIVFAGDMAGQTIPLYSELVITKELTVDGSSLSTPVTISGRNAVRVFAIAPSGVVTLSALRIISGTTYEGGGIYNEGQLMLQSITLSGNKATYYGGGIYNTVGSTLTVMNSTLSGNSANLYSGGGIDNRGTLTLQSSTLSGNAADEYGGGISNGGVLVVTNSTFSGNSAKRYSGGGISNSGQLTVQSSTFSGNAAHESGGGICNYEQLVVQSSTLSGNLAESGGGIGNWDTLMVANSTLSGNSANLGGGIYNTDQLTVQSSTFSGNSAPHGGGIYNGSYSTLNYESTLIANSPTGGDCSNNGTIGTNAHNLVEDGTCGPALSGDPRLALLANNGGPSTGSGQAPSPLLTHALLPGSPAIDAVPLGTCIGSTDQRGFPRPYPTSGQCDVGAYEAGPLRLAKTATPATDVPYHGLVTYTLVLSNTGGASDPSVWLTDTLPAEVDFDSWVVSQTDTLLDGGEIRWHGSLAAGQVMTWAFGVRHTGEYGDHVTNLARFSGTSDHGSGQASFDTVCTPTYTVENPADAGAGSLRQGIAGVCPGGNIFFSGDLSITLGSELAIAKWLTIDGEGHAITVSGNDAVRVFNIASSGVVTLSALRIVSGTARDGGGIANYGQLTLQSSTLSGNEADPNSGDGGGIANYGQLTVTNSTLSGNSAHAAGGIYNAASGSQLTLQSSTLSGNEADYGGGIYNYGTLTVTNSALSGNSATNAGGIYNEGVLIVYSSTFSGNSSNGEGGSIYNSTVSTLTIQSSTLSGNNASWGGGVYNRGTLTVRSSTFSGNSAGQNGGGICNSNSQLTVQSSTFSGNSATYGGGGIYNGSYSTLNYQNTLIANSPVGGDCSSNGTIGTNAYNLVEDGTCSPRVSGDPQLGTLADNGGPSTGSGQSPSPMLTHALLPGSPAIDVVPNANCIGSTDQRGFPRPYPVGGACDIGAYEAGALRLTKTAAPATDVPYHGLVTYTLILSNPVGAGEDSVWLTDTLPAEASFDSWVISQTDTFLDGDEIRWHGGLATGQAIDWIFRIRHTGDYSDHVTNLAYFSSTYDHGSGQASFDVACTPIYTVENAADAGAGSLRQAIARVCPGGRILFSGDLDITLGSELAIAKRLTIDGEGHAITVSGGNAVRVFTIASGSVVTLSALRIVSGTAYVGGGILNHGQLTVQSSTLSGNSASRDGGGIDNWGQLMVTNSTLSGNEASEDGGGIDNWGQLAVTNSTLSGNKASENGGGIDNYGGVLTVTNSTLSGNTSTYESGGGIYNSGQLTVRSSTLSGNSVRNNGGGIYNGGTLNYQNTIIANSTHGGDCYNDSAGSGAIGTNAYNLVEDGSCSDGAVGFLTGDPRLGPLQANAGPSTSSGQGMWTHALLPNSPAIDAGNTAGGNATCPPTDQRGWPRDDLRCDIGVFELRPHDSDTVIKSGFVGGVPYSFGPTWISLTLSAADPGSITVTKHLTYPGGVADAGEMPATWWITSALSTGLPLTLSLCYTDAEIAGLLEGSLRAFRWDGVGWTVPVSTGLAVDEAANCVTLTGVDQFSAWTLKDISTGGSPTAVTLREFGAETTYTLFLLGVCVLLLGALALVWRRK